MPYLFSPPQRKQTVQLAGALRISYRVSSTVFKLGGKWVAMETPSQSLLLTADQLLAVSGRPQILPDPIALDIIAQGLSTLAPGADYPATCEAIQI